MSLRFEFSGSPEVGASRSRVWHRLVDPQFVAGSAPGIESVREVAPGHFQLVSAVGVGPLKVQLTIDIEIFDLVEPERAQLRAQASAPGSTVTVLSALRLDETGASRTQLHWTATTDIDGALAGLGPGLMASVAQKLTSDFWADFARRVETAS